MNIELDEVVCLDVSDDSLEEAAGNSAGGSMCSSPPWFGFACRSF